VSQWCPGDGCESCIERFRQPPDADASPQAGHQTVDGCGADGCTEAIMLAHGFTIEQMVELVRAGLATATAERVVAGSRTFEVATVRITDDGRRVLKRARR
jgi:hypothetical protein